MFRCLVLFQFRTPTWSLEGEKRLSIFISPLDLFWAVIKVHLPLRISIMISLTLVYMRHIDCPGLLAHLLLNLRSCEFTQRHVWLMKVRIPCNIVGCFTTSQPTAFALTGRKGQLRVRWQFPVWCRDCFGIRQLPVLIPPRCCWITQWQSVFPVSIIVLLSGSGKHADPWHATIWLGVCRRERLVVRLALTNIIQAL